MAHVSRAATNAYYDPWRAMLAATKGAYILLTDSFETTIGINVSSDSGSSNL